MEIIKVFTLVLIMVVVTIPKIKTQTIFNLNKIKNLKKKITGNGKIEMMMTPMKKLKESKSKAAGDMLEPDFILLQLLIFMLYLMLFIMDLSLCLFKMQPT
jgi:hypothetical protein